MADEKIRVLIVDDSAIVRGLMTRALKSEPAIEIVGAANNGQIALDMLKQDSAIDIIILDIEMPMMDGMTALPEIIKLAPKAKVIMASTLTLRNAEISIRALALGATDYLPKPTAHGGNDSEVFFRELIAKVKGLAPREKATAARSSASAVRGNGPITLVQPSSAPIQALAIASSTGGPQALLRIFESLKGRSFRVPVFITQHMPPSFTTIMADHISKGFSGDCHEGVDGEEVKAGKIYLAPGDHHMLVEGSVGVVRLRLNQDAPENFCRPAADPMFRSLSHTYGAGLLAVVLTGLGADGAKGAAQIVENKGTAIAQDEASSVVYGMPRAAAETGKMSAILPVGDVAPYLMKAGIV